MPRSREDVLRENSVKAFKQILYRFTNKNLGVYVGEQLGISYKTGLKRVSYPETLTIRDLRDLGLTDNEILRVVRGRCLEV